MNNKIYEPYGFNEGEYYNSLRNAIDDEIRINRATDNKQDKDIDSVRKTSFSNVSYDNNLESLVFKNVSGETIGILAMASIFPSKLIKSAKYDKTAKKIFITFDNDDVVEIAAEDLMDTLEAGDGLKIQDGIKYAVKVADDSETFLQVGENGIKNVGIQDAINVERDRAISAETVERNERIDYDRQLLNLIETETANRISADDAEKARAISEEKRIDKKLDEEIDRATKTETQLNSAISNEGTARNAADLRLENMINGEIESRKNAIVLVNRSIDSMYNKSSVNSMISSLQEQINSLKARIAALESKD